MLLCLSGIIITLPFHHGLCNMDTALKKLEKNCYFGEGLGFILELPFTPRETPVCGQHSVALRKPCHNLNNLHVSSFSERWKRAKLTPTHRHELSPAAISHTLKRHNF